MRCDGHQIPELLDAILRLFPLDQYVAKPAALMEVVPGDPIETPIWQRYQEIILHRTGLQEPFEFVERFDYYERAGKAYAVVAKAHNMPISS